MSKWLIINGGCHCGALSYELEWPGKEDGEPVSLPGRKCGCSFCTRMDGTWTSHPDARLVIRENPELPASRYRFGTGTADFLFCSRCGVAPLVTCDIDGRTFAVVNVNTFEKPGDEEYELKVTSTDFDGETVENRLERRAARWIGQVENA